jgi:acylglycerol lipase
MATADREGWIRADADVRIYWQAWLPADSPVAIVVRQHGVAEHGGRYMQAVRSLVASGCGVYAFDARAHGRSEGTRASFDRFAQLVDDLTPFLGRSPTGSMSCRFSFWGTA